MKEHSEQHSVLLAAVLSLLVFGLGHIYVGRLRRLLMAFLALLLVAGILSVVGIISTPGGMWTLLVSIAVFWLFLIIDPIWIAGTTRPSESRRYKRWYVYAAWPFIVITAGAGLQAARRPLLGLDIVRMQSSAMTPAVLEGDFVAVDTRAFSRRAPAAGDIVLVTSPGSNKALLRQIIEVSDNQVTIGTRTGGAQVVSRSDIGGRLTCIFYSRDLNRIGAL